MSYYAGGFGGQGSGPGPAIGISFSSGLAAETGPTAIGMGPAARLTAPSATMNLDFSWGGLISFYFVGNGAVSFYSDLDAGGDLIASYTLSYPPFFPFGETPGPFQSAVFESATGLELDSITLGAQVVPEPSSLSLMLVGVGLLSCARLHGRR